VTFRKFHRALSLCFFLLILLLTFSVEAQKKRRFNSDAQPQGAKLREAEFYFTEGEKYFILEDYAKALLYYQKTLEFDPDNATVHFKVAEVLARGSHQDDMQKAVVSIEKALKLEKTNKYFYILAATIYNNLGKFDKAAQTYENLIEEVKGSDEYLYELAAVYQYANKPEESIKAYNRAETVLGINEVSSIQKQRLYLELGKTKEAIIEGEKLIAAFPDEERYVMGFAEVLSQKGQRPLAISYLEKFIVSNAEAGNAKMLLAGLYRDSNQEQKARQLLVTIFDDNTIDLNSKVIMLGAYSTELNQNQTAKSNDTDKAAFALSLFEKLEKAYPQETNVHIIGGDLYLSSGRDREAQKEYALAVESEDVNFEVWQNLLYLEVKLDQFDKVISHSERALEIFPNQGIFYYFNGYAHWRKRHYEESVEALNQAKKLSSSNTKLIGEIDGMLGDAYNALKDFEKSDQAYEDALEINANNYNVLNNYSYYLAIRKVNLDKAEKMASLLIKNNPDNPTFLDTYAWVLYMKEKYKEAKKVMEKALSTGHASATHFEHYGDILFKIGDVDGAVQQWEKAKGLNANTETLNKKIANRRIYE
jgi:tetratricopeptide (TPR) repeat protein